MTSQIIEHIPNHCAHCAIRFENKNVQWICAFFLSSSHKSSSVHIFITDKHNIKKHKIKQKQNELNPYQNKNNNNFKPSCSQYNHHPPTRAHSKNQTPKHPNDPSFSHRHPRDGAFSSTFLKTLKLFFNIYLSLQVKQNKKNNSKIPKPPSSSILKQKPIMFITSTK